MMMIVNTCVCDELTHLILSHLIHSNNHQRIGRCEVEQSPSHQHIPDADNGMRVEVDDDGDDDGSGVKPRRIPRVPFNAPRERVLHKYDTLRTHVDVNMLTPYFEAHWDPIPEAEEEHVDEGEGEVIDGGDGELNVCVFT